MKFLIITHVEHSFSNNQYYAYGPYVREINLWVKNVDEVIIVAPISEKNIDLIDLPYRHKNIHFVRVPSINFTSIKHAIKSALVVPWILFKLIKNMNKADHIHLRCPGNMGLLGSIVQIFFPWKKKTAKYAGNWDPEMRKTATYNWQRSILSDERLSKNMTVLVYGEWPNQPRNILPFFTASYINSEIIETPVRLMEGRIKCLYCGYLLREKRPILSIHAIETLLHQGIDIELTLLGDGEEFQRISTYIDCKNLNSRIFLKGNVPPSEVKNYMKQSHFLTFFGHDSEGWPKAVAEAMFWGCVPLVRSVSCTRYMLGYGERGTIVEDSVESMVAGLKKYIHQQEYYYETAEKAMQWSRQYTLERFEEEILKLLIK